MRRVLLIAASAALAAAAVAAPAAHAGSLYSGPGPRPGPDLLYSPPVTAPQLTNNGVWQADPVLISGATAYRKGEFLYQDFLYDDHGANGGGRDPTDKRASGDTFSSPNGTYTYPTASGYAGNAADLVELRVRPLTDATAFRLTLNTMKDPSLLGATIAIGATTPPVAVPYTDSDLAAAAMFVTLKGGSAADLRRADGSVVDSSLGVAVDTTRRQVEIRVPHTDFNPGTGPVRLAAGTGLWDKAAGRYLVPGPAADATHPGGAGLLGRSAFFNLAFRTNEGLPNIQSATEPFTAPAWWRDRAQADALKGPAPRMDSFPVTVDFAKLAAGTTDNSGVPASGPMDRIMSSRLDAGQGTDYTTTCGAANDCIGELRGNLLPYAIYVPRKTAPAGGYGLTLLLHSLAANYNQFLGSSNQSQFGERAGGAIVITPTGRGPDGWYYGHAGADTFEAWADAAAHYPLNSEHTAIAGYSMGGYGTYKFATQFPDLFAKAQPTVGPPGLGIWLPPADPTGGKASNTNRMLASLRNLPFLIWDGAMDQLVPLPGPVAQAQTFASLGLRYEFDVFTPADHFALAVNDQFQPAADFLGTSVVDRNPAHVTYVVNPTMDFASLGTRADHAYWLSDLRLRDGSGSAPLGQIDARSHAFGQGDPKPSGVGPPSAGLLTGGSLPAIAFTSFSQGWGPAVPEPRADQVDVDARNVRSGSVATARAGLTCAATVKLTSDGPIDLAIAGCNRTVSLSGAGTVVSTAALPARRSCKSRRVFTIRLRHGHPAAAVRRVVITINGKRRRTLRGKAARRTARVDLRGLPAGRMRVRVATTVVTRGRSRTLTETRTYRTCVKRR